MNLAKEDWADPRELFGYSRLDLIWRYHYALHHRSAWSQSAASDYLKATSILSGSQKIKERGFSLSAKERLVSFDLLLTSIEKFGFKRDLATSPIIVSDNGVLLNGAHRVAAAYALNIPKIPIERFPGVLPSFSTNYQGLIQAGFRNKEAEGYLLECLRIRKNARFMLLFSESEKYSIPMCEQVGKAAQIVHQFSFCLTDDGVKRLIELAYSMTDWWTPTYIDDIAHSKTKNEHAPFSAHLIVYVPDNSDSDTRELKLSVREYLESLGMDGRQLHGSDSWDDTAPVLEILLVEGGRFFLNNAPYSSERGLMHRLESEVSAAGPVPTLNVLAGSVVLELHGLRVAHDIDFFSLHPPLKDKHDWDCRNFLPEYSSQTVWDVCSSKESFVYKGFRFQSLEMYLRCQDVKRLTKKGRSDYRLASAIFNDKGKFLLSSWANLTIIRRRVKFGMKIFIFRTYGRTIRMIPLPVRRAIKHLIRMAKKT